MAHVEQVDVLIVGSGPAGSSTALHLIKSNPEWAGRIVMVDKAVHPREKLCGGGLTHLAQNVLIELGLPLDVPSFDVKNVRLTYEGKSYSFHGNPVFRIVRREEFDHWLADTAVSLGVTLRQGEGVIDVIRHDGYTEIITEKTTFHAKVVVAADGSRSFIRRRLKWPGQSHVARLIEVLTPEDADAQPEFRDGVALFDFTPMTTHNLQGYYWDFPSFVNGKAYMNRGVFDSRARPEKPKADLKAILRDELTQRGLNLDDYKLKGHPIRWWDDSGPLSMPGIILAGDAAGADPLVGEGIAFALKYGTVAAQAINDAFARQDFSFTTYRDIVLADGLFAQLRTRTRLARLAYQLRYPLVARTAWRIAPHVIKRTRWRDPNYVPTIPPSPQNSLVVG
jgi:geranylgeranyl reductase family protein